MRTYDLTPLFRSTVGFDRLARLMDSASQVDSAPSYPPYNIEKLSDDDYRITMAVAGFSEKDLEITVQENSLLIAGRMEKSEEDEGVSFLHRGIATRAFERRFDLADDIKVVGATVENGLLNVALVRVVPEEKKPRRIEIGSGTPKAIEKKAA
jgi:molecular chaperone IbpA